MLAVRCEDQVKQVTFALCEVPSFSCDDVLETANKELFIHYSVQRFGAGRKQSQLSQCGKRLTWCLVPTASAHLGMW